MTKLAFSRGSLARRSAALCLLMLSSTLPSALAAGAPAARPTLSAASEANAAAASCVPCARSGAGAADSAPEAYRHPPLGPVYAPSEPDLLALIEDRARRAYERGEWQARLAEHRRALAAWSDRPAPGIPSGTLPRADRVEKRRLTTPYAQLRDALQQNTPGGSNSMAEALQSSGPLLAALDALRRTYLFIDADDPAQRRFAAAYALGRIPFEGGLAPGDAPLRIVLVKGSLSEMRRDAAEAATTLERRESVRVYFDQAGGLRRLFRLTSLPAVVSLSADAALVTTIPITDEGRPRPIERASDVVELPPEAMPLDPAHLEAARAGMQRAAALMGAQPRQAVDVQDRSAASEPLLEADPLLNPNPNTTAFGALR